MNDRLDILDRLYDGLKFKNATYTENNNTCVMNFLYNPDVFKPNEQNRIELLNKFKEIIGDYVKFDIKFTN